jgi:hypothetical protein
MKKFLKASKVDRLQVFRSASDHHGLDVLTIEKDFWVSYLLDILFNRLALSSRFMFKGGTSLSKCYGLIERFSEDIDLSLHMEDLGFRGDQSPFKEGQSNSALQKIRKDLEAAGREFVNKELVPALQIELEKDLKSNEFSLKSDGQNINFHYPKILLEREYPAANYVKPQILIETGTKAAHIPCEEKEVRALCLDTDTFRDEFGPVVVKSLSPKRTFWEKVTILHAENNINKAERVKGRMSRHLYDIHQILQSSMGPEALADLELLADVAKHKGIVFRDKKAKYEEACPGSLKVNLSEDLREPLRKDYEAMGTMFYSKNNPSFNELLESLNTIDAAVNAI